jgi:hypothetical protein
MVFILEREGISCRTTTTAAQPFAGIARLNTTSHAVTGIRADESRTFPLSREGLCAFAGEGRFSGTGTTTVLGTTATVSVRLI